MNIGLAVKGQLFIPAELERFISSNKLGFELRLSKTRGIFLTVLITANSTCFLEITYLFEHAKQPLNDSQFVLLLRIGMSYIQVQLMDKIFFIILDKIALRLPLKRRALQYFIKVKIKEVIFWTNYKILTVLLGPNFSYRQTTFNQVCPIKAF